MILVTGATGQVGGHLVALLTRDGHAVRAVVEPGVQPPWPTGGPVQTVVADFGDEDALTQAAAGADRVFMLVPPSPLQPVWQRNIVKAAQGATRIVKLSAFDSGPASKLSMGRWHHDGEEALRLADIPHVILRPQYFMQNLLHDEGALRGGLLRTFIPPELAVGMVDAHDVAAVAAAALLAPTIGERVLVPTGPAAVTTGQFATAVSTAVGREVHEMYLPPPQARAALIAAGSPGWRADDTVEICQTASAQVTDCVPSLLGRPARGISEVVIERLRQPRN
jgi:uncharacterized protein YbjT (DUF2867 family)